MAPQHVGEGDRDWRDCGEIAEGRARIGEIAGRLQQGGQGGQGDRKGLPYTSEHRNVGGHDM